MVSFFRDIYIPFNEEKYVNLKEDFIMKGFFKDYGELCKQAGSFYKRHWLGSIIMTLVTSLVSIMVFWPKEFKQEVADEIKSKFKRGSKEEA